ncbi:type II secretion system F family protein [Candidatus Woesearchaeota archaeon]|nr:type II secretion system F family protein [Candidatus Woesearchaeota archaeon]
MLYEQIQKKIEEAEKIIAEIESIKRDYKDALKDFNKLNKEFVKEKIDQEKYKEEAKKFERSDARGGNAIKKMIGLLDNLKQINQDICKLFEVKEKIVKGAEVDVKRVKAFVKSLRKVRGSEEKVKYSTYSYNFLGRYANQLFDKTSKRLARNYPDYFESLYKNLRLANIRVFSNTYINLGLMGSCFGSLIAFLSGFFIFGFGLFDLVKSLMLGVLFFFILLFIFYYYPKVVVDNRRREIKNDLPFAIIHMAAVAGSGAKLVDIFGMLLHGKEYKALAGEIKRIMNYVHLFGYNLTTALKYVAETSPSDEFKELLNGMVGSIESGGSIKNFLKSKAEDTLIRYRLDRKKYVETLSTYTDIYTAVLIAAPLLFVIVLVLISIVGTKLGGLDIGFIEKLGTFVVVPALNIGFIVFMNIVQPEI